MTRTIVHAGICGFETRVTTRLQDDRCQIEIESDCSAIKKLGENLTSVDPFNEISYRGEIPETMKQATLFCMHAACPVPVAIIKAIEVESGLALPAEVRIHIEQNPEDSAA